MGLSPERPRREIGCDDGTPCHYSCTSTCWRNVGVAVLDGDPEVVPVVHEVPHRLMLSVVRKAMALAYSRNLQMTDIVEDTLNILGQQGWVLIRAEDL